LGKGKPWLRTHELHLRELVKAGKTVEELAAELEKSSSAIKLKLRRLELEVVVPDEKKLVALLLLFILLFLLIFPYFSF
jgi:hypothetical protein